MKSPRRSPSGRRPDVQELPSGDRTTAKRGKRPFSPRWLRIVAGEMRGRRVEYSGDPAIRPMKDRTRESVFNLLGGDLSGTIAIDLFAGTGVLGLESISRGSVRAILLELSRPAVTTIVSNAQRLKIAECIEVHNVDTFRWLKYIESTAAPWMDSPWVVFCCPPYQLWTTDLPRLKEGLLKLFHLSPAGSMFVVESELEFDVAQSIPELEWDVRTYKPAKISIACR